MISRVSSLAVMALAGAAVAHPHRGHHHHPSASGTGAPYGYTNGTGPYGTGYPTGYPTGTGLPTSIPEEYTSTVSFTSTVVQTVQVTVYPVASASAVSAADAGGAGAGTGIAAASGVCSSRSTSTSTFINRVTVTVQPSSAVDAAATSKAKVCTKKTKSSGTAVSVTPTPAASTPEAVNPSSFVLYSSAESSAPALSSVQAEAYTGHKQKTTKASSVIPVSSAAAPSSQTPAASSSAAPVYTTPAASSAAAPSSSAAASATGGYGGSTGTGKRGLAYNDASLTNCFSGNSKISWAYNWGQTSTGLGSGFEYVPMLWSTRSDFTGSWEKNVKAAISAGSKHVLAFNEPDLGEQANMSPSAAAQGYQTYIQPLKSSNPDVRLGSPAVTNGGDGMGLDWLSSFMTACSSCTIDFVAIHWYDSAANVEYFKSHVEDAHTKTGKPVWITEFGASGSDSEVSSFLEQVMPWLDSQDYVERYAYFMVSSGKLVSGTSPSVYGKTYAS